MVQFRKGRKSPWMVQLRDSTGKLITASFERKQDAEEFESKKRREKKLTRHGLESPKDSLLMIDYAKLFLTRRFKSMPRSTVNQDESRLRNYWLTKFGKRPIQTISSSEIKEHLDLIQFEHGHSAADRNRHRALMHKFFQDALMDDKVVYNPVTKIPLVDEKRTRRKVAVLGGPADSQAYIDAAYAIDPNYGMLATLLLWAGLRISEAIALQYRDIDFIRDTLTVKRILERASNSIVERFKNESDIQEHVMPMFPVVKHSIVAHEGVSPFVRPTDFICTRSDGQFISYDTFKQVHKRILENAGLPSVTIHDLRRTFASNAQKAGFSKGELQEIFGHSSVTVTERYTVMDIEHILEKGKRLQFGFSSAVAIGRTK
jgi:integrase